MANELLILLGDNDEKSVQEKLIPYVQDNKNEFKHVNISNDAVKRVKEKFKISEEVFKNIMNNDIFKALISSIYSKCFYDKNEAEYIEDKDERNEMLEEIKTQNYFYQDNNGNYQVFLYMHLNPKLDSAEIRENIESLNGISPFMQKGSIDLKTLINNERFKKLTSLIDLNGVWHNIEGLSLEETINNLIKIVESIPNGTKMTVIHYHY